MHVQYQLATLKKGSDSVAIYYQKAKMLRDTLSAAGKTLSSSDFITFLLAGLGSDYDSMVTSITTQVDALSPPQVYSHLLTHEARLSHQHAGLTATTEFSANSTYKHQPDSNNRGRGSPRSRGNYRARGRGHNGNAGRPPHTFFPSNRPTCQVCLKFGHTALNCYHRFNHGYQSSPPPSLMANFTAVPPPPASVSSIDTNWYPDSTATHHFTHDFSNLSISPTEYKGEEQVCVGDGTTLPIHHVGSSSMPSTSGFPYSPNSGPRQH